MGDRNYNGGRPTPMRDLSGGASDKTSGRLHAPTSMQLQFVARRQRWKRLMWLFLIPEGDRGDVVLQELVASVRLPAQCLNRHLEIVLEPDGVRDVPPIEAKSLLRIE